LVEDLVMDKAGVSIDSDLEDETESGLESAEAIAEHRPDEDQLSVFRDFINTLDLDDLEK